MKEVQIRRRETKSHLPVPVVANSIKILSSIFDGGGPLRGVTGEKEKELLSKYLGIDKNDPILPEEIRRFWIDIRVKVPSEGVVLNITTNDDGYPVNIYDYLIYSWAKKHKFVANNKSEMDNDGNKRFYIHDPDVESLSDNAKVRIKRAAYQEFTKVVDNRDKMDMIVKILDDVDPESMTDTQLENHMETIVLKDPQKFVAVATDKNLELKALVSDLISKNILRKIGNSIFFIEEKLGDGIDDAVVYLKDKKNSEMLMVLKAKLQEFKK